MSKLIRKNHGYLHVLVHGLPQQKQALLDTASAEQIHAICEVCYNLLKEVIPSSEEQRSRLCNFKAELLDLASPSVPFKKKKKIISQTGGGFIEDVISPLLGGFSLNLL